MRDQEATAPGGGSGLRKRRITLEDGRYLIFYTDAADEAPPSRADGSPEPPTREEGDV